ncbi:MAG: preprotein translocase subunit SecE [Patescibacteria group bacterium]
MNFKETRLVKYLLESKAELKKVTWPTKKETVRHTIIVVAISLFVAFFLGFLDFGLTKLLAVILK